VRIAGEPMQCGLVTGNKIESRLCRPGLATTEPKPYTRSYLDKQLDQARSDC
jgi:hypothetical protein